MSKLFQNNYGKVYYHPVNSDKDSNLITLVNIYDHYNHVQMHKTTIIHW
jgi:hypothetical protein